MNFALVTGACLLTVIVVHGATFFIARRVGRYNVVDIAWSIARVHRFSFHARSGPGGADSPSLVR
jgi:steroid 5-alpha reductase family enzyme